MGNSKDLNSGLWERSEALLGSKAPFPESWRDFLAVQKLAGQSLFITPEHDLSGTGIDIRIFTEAEAAYEISHYRPAMDVIRIGLVPVGECVMGTGNPYFIRHDQGEDSPLYRVDHACALGVSPGVIKTKNFEITLAKASDLAEFDQ